MYIGIEGIVEAAIDNVGVGFEWTVLIIFILGALIFFAKDFKIGMLILLITNAGLFIWFYNEDLNYTLPLTVFFMSLVILALSLFAVEKSSTTGGFQ